MTAAFIVLPDAIGPTIDYLNALAEVQALGLKQLSVKLDPDGERPAVRVDPTGGSTPVEWRLDQPNLQFACLAETEAEALLIARTLRAGMAAMVGHRVPGVLVVRDVDTSSPRLIDDRDRTAPVPHASFSATVTVRPDP